MTDLRELAQPLLTDPPHPPPALAELKRQVDRRRRRRAGSIGSAFVVVLVVLAALALVVRDPISVEVADGPAEVTPPPALVAGAVRMIVSPESAPLDIPRTIELRNDGTEPYWSCGDAVLARWAGDEWQTVAEVHFGDGTPTLNEYRPNAFPDCTTTTVAPHTSTAIPFAPATATWPTGNGTIPPRTDELSPGWYELRHRRTSPNENETALGRFQITAPGTPTPTDPARLTPVTIDLFPDGVAAKPPGLNWPGPDTIGSGGPVLPTDVVAVDRDTVALAFRSSCNQPATEVEVIPSADEIELRLSMGQFFTIDCVGESDRWIVTFDLPFELDDDVRVVARAPGGETERQPGPILGSSSPSWQLGSATPVSFRAAIVGDEAAPGVIVAHGQVPWPLVDAGVACEAELHRHGGVAIPEVRVQLPTPDVPVQPCDGPTFRFEVPAGTTMLGQP